MPRCRLALALLTICCSSAAVPAAPGPAAAKPADGDVVAAYVVSRVGDSGVPDDKPKRARKGDTVTLFAVAAVKKSGKTIYLADEGSISIDGRKVATHPWTDAPSLAIAWNRIEPAVASMSNEASGQFAFEPIDYRATSIAKSDGKTQLPADVRPTLTPDHGDGAGTMRFQVVITSGDHAVASAGADARRGRGSGGLTDAVHRISIRRDDSYLGYLTELYGQPYIWASAGSTDATHQSERLEGADCADFVVYGARRMGLRIPYTWTEDLPTYAKTLAKGAPDEKGIYRDAHGDPIAFTGVGDLVLFPRHVGVLVEDRGTKGVLDDQDVIMHALFDTPKEVPIADSGYAGLPISVLRFPFARSTR
jgi:hypothetical protein